MDEKLFNTAWARIFERFKDDRAGFAKEYAKMSIGGAVLWHEGHHITTYCDDREVAEAAAQLCQLAKGEMPLAALVDLYYWKRCKKPLYTEAAKMAFTYLEESGYSETQRDAKTDGHHGATEAGLKKQAEKALELISNDYKIRGLAPKRNFSKDTLNKLHEQVEQALSYGFKK